MNFEKKVIIVTGVSSGIGEGCAKKLLACNAHVIGFDLRPGKLTEKNYQHYLVDVRDAAQVSAIVDEVAAHFDKIDGLVNCAGIFSCSKPFYEMTVEEWNKVISINLTGTFLCTRFVTPHMITQRQGKIVNISCIRSQIFRPGMADYSASKGGVVALTSAMALDLAPFNIQVNSVGPGFTFTGMTAAEFCRPEVKASSEQLIPLGRIAEPSDIADTILFLLSDLSNYITGQTIFTDGGFKIAK
ncbi:short-chain dehydrogenase/reductase SDR [Candidatus Vecturithrix granuli]|uniref:Short-chain dehydrogenase/reductase SDR n=1 Tax=Vecturithrix granuli TaxID=1499967 RepID=A0A081C9J0_VECG1|nr:short-chain dehydrogenase/reductase SDR [Candidatus Vecturithrix granuli]